MDSTQPTRLNSMQQYRLHLFERKLLPQQEKEIRELLSNYSARQVDVEIDAIVAERGITADQLKEAAKVHRRTPYQPKR